MSGFLPVWIQRLLGMESSVGDAAVWSLDYSWPWPPWLSILMVAAIGGYVLGMYRRERASVSSRRRAGLAALRLAAMGVLLVMAARLTLSIERTGLPNLAILVDDSRSMARADRFEAKEQAAIESRVSAAGYSEPSRWNQARTILTERDAAALRDLTERYKVRMYYVAAPGGVRPGAVGDVEAIRAELNQTTPDVGASPLGAGVRAILDDLRGVPPAAIVLLTDGINTEGPSLADAAAIARRKGVALFPVALGSDRPIRELKLADLLVDDAVFAGDLVTFELKASGIGLAGQKVRVSLREKGRPQPLAGLEIAMPPDGVAKPILLSHRFEEARRHDLAIEAKTLEGTPEAVAQIERSIEVRKEKIRVLLVAARPNFEYRFLRNMLGRDEAIELHSLLQEADAEHGEQDAASLKVFPVRRDELFAYDVVILDDANPRLLGETGLRHLADFVTRKSKGGAMALIAGPNFLPAAYRNTPLAALMPIDPASARIPTDEPDVERKFHVRPTELGLSFAPMQLGETADESRSVWNGLPALDWLVEAPQVRPSARVLAEHPSRLGQGARRLPVICLQYSGSGRVLMHLTDETWRWRYRAGDLYFGRYWVQMIRFLARSKLTADQKTVELTAEQREYRPGEPVRLSARFADERAAPSDDDGVVVAIDRPGQKTQRLTLSRTAANRGTFEGVLAKPAPGRYRAWIAVPPTDAKTAATTFEVLAPPGELERLVVETAALQQIAEKTKGRFYTFQTADELFDELPAGRQVPVEMLPPIPLWNRWPMLALFLTLVIAEWIWRKRAGLV